jgi:PIN domain nuclease of toxin-antitoxin system
MRVLLDTHAFLWWIDNDPRLSTTARSMITDSDNELYFSAASGWEIAMKAQIGKLNLPDKLEQFIIEQVVLNQFTVLPIQLSHTLHVYTLPLLHRDPFDRLLVAQSQLEDLLLLTDDAFIQQYTTQTIW